MSRIETGASAGFKASARVRRTALASGLAAVLLPAAAADGETPAADDIVARSKAAYAALDSYGDTGTVEVEYGTRGAPLIRERHTFTTRFRKPRHYYFEFNEDPSAGGDRFVVWSDDEAFRTWWKTTGVEETYPQGRGVAALTTAAGVTNGTAVIVTPLLFPQANLEGPIHDFVAASYAGTEEIAGRDCHRVEGRQQPVYATTGRAGAARNTILWIDTATYLLCRVFEDTPETAPSGSVQRATTTFEARLNPDLADPDFRFAAPREQVQR